MEKLKTIDIKGKDYVLVNDRLSYFREAYKGYSLETEVVFLDENYCVLKAVIKDDKERVVATGLAREVNGSTFINKTSYVENCETSAWGRALGNLGIGIDTSVASYEEVANAIEQQKQPAKKPDAKTTSTVLNPLWMQAQSYGIDLDKLAIYYKKETIEDVSDEDIRKAIEMKIKGGK